MRKNWWYNLLQPLKPALRPVRRRFLRYFWYIVQLPNDVRYYMKHRNETVTPMPPSTLRYRVAGRRGSTFRFDDIGRRSRAALESILQAHNHDIHQFNCILDFGVGCSRTMRWMRDLAPNADLHGADTDADAIAWNQKAISYAKFTVNQALPPLPYSDNTFDLIYSISVFTHIDEAYQDRWLGELKRVACPGAILLLTVHNENAWHRCLAGQGSTEANVYEQQYKSNGIAYVKNRHWEGMFPDYYQNTFHTPDYIKRHWGTYFEVIEQAKNYFEVQDFVVLRHAHKDMVKQLNDS